MLNLRLGTETSHEGRRSILVTEPGHGHAVYGPYLEFEAGRYRVTFQMQPTAPSAPDDLAAFVDVCGDFGRRRYALDAVFANDLANSPSVTLDFDLPRPDTLEFRVEASGRVPLIIGDEPVVDAITPEIPSRNGIDPNDPALSALARRAGLCVEDIANRSRPPEQGQPELPSRLSRTLALLRPHEAKGFSKRRIGTLGDGGYVCVDDFTGIDAVLSLGINDNVDFDLEVAAPGIRVYQFDHTVEAPCPGDDRMIFEKKMISLQAGANSETLPRLIRRLDQGLSRPNIFLKMDIENWEWPVLDAISPEDLGRIRQITGEFHAFEYAIYPAWIEQTERVIAKIVEQFALVHVHGNNCANSSTFGSITLPNVLEFTFLNRSCYDLVVSDEIFPTPLDAPCDPARPDYSLGRFDYALCRSHLPQT